jgi:RND family efflux transporter MFP subunit
VQPQSNTPRLNITIADQQLQISIENERVRVGLSLREWLQANQNLMSEKDMLSVVKDVKKHLATLSDFFYDTSIAVNGLTLATNPQLSQSTVDKYKSDIAAARATINTVLSSITAAETSEQTAETALATAQRQLALDQAGATAEDIAAETAQVKSAQADVANIKAKIASYTIRAPFAGIVTRVDAKVGQVASAGETQVSLISGGMYEIESYVPEVHIANIVVGNDVNVTLDAYGESTKFSAIVTAIDPAETIKDGVSTYKVTLQFKEKDERIKPGMTANVQIVTVKKNDAIVIPQGLIKTEKGISQVSLLQNGQVVSQTVETGGTTALGQVEVISGLQDGDVIVADPIKK